MRCIVPIFSFLVCISCRFVVGEKIDYSNYKLAKLYPQTEEQWNAVTGLKDSGVHSLYRDRHSTLFALSPDIAPIVEKDMTEIGVQFETLFDDVQKLIDSQKVNMEPLVNGSLEWDRYYNLADIHQFLDDQAEIHSPNASTFSVGTSYEGRDLKAIKISKSGETKPAIWIDANIHAREWITGAVCTYIIDQLLNSDDPEIQAWLDDYDFYILPVLNPDGFDYSHTTDRFWRKSRSDNGSPVGCIGTDLNRNFDFHWLENGGASSDPCSSAYAGPSPFSDKEAAALRDFMPTISSRLVFYLSLHSAGQYILLPTGFTADHIPQHNTYMEIANAAAEAHLVRYGTNFTAGNTVELMYVATGISMDWVKDTFNTNLTLTYELRDKGQYGHLLPPEQILPSCLEFMDGFKVIMEKLALGIPEVDP